MNQTAVKTMMREGKVAIFINDWNVWDVPPQDLTPEVRKAILHAYELGCVHTAESVRTVMSTVSMDNKFNFDVDIPLPERPAPIKKKGRATWPAKPRKLRPRRKRT